MYLKTRVVVKFNNKNLILINISCCKENVVLKNILRGQRSRFQTLRQCIKLNFFETRESA